jgi:hypothetical protein
MKTDWIFNQEVKACLVLWPTVLLKDEVVPSGYVVAMEHHLEEATLVVEAEEIGKEQVPVVSTL